LSDGLGKHASQPARCRVKPVVLEGVDGVFHAVLIKPEGNRPYKRRRRQPAGPAKRWG
jgi:hypothetical protein